MNLHFIISTAALILTLALQPAMLPAQEVSSVVGFPASEPGYALGVSACYAGKIGNHLIMAGGCNFITPGHKTFYAGVYAARIDRKVLNWRLVGWLPESAAYGISVSAGDSIVIAGGCNEKHSLATAYSLHLNATADSINITPLTSLPCTIDNMAAACANGQMYIVGGNANGKASKGVWSANIADGKPLTWQKHKDMPGMPRVQPVAAATGNKVYVWGGFHADGNNSMVHTDGISLNTSTEIWTSLPAPTINNTPATLSGGIAYTPCNATDNIIAMGGVNKDIFLDAISGRYSLVDKSNYLNQPIAWYAFNKRMYTFSTKEQVWLPTTFDSTCLARAGAQAVPTNIGCFYIGGELKPALRTPQIVLISNRQL